MGEVVRLLIGIHASLGLVADSFEVFQHWLDEVASALIELRTLLGVVPDVLDALQDWLDVTPAFVGTAVVQCFATIVMLCIFLHSKAPNTFPHQQDLLDILQVKYLFFSFVPKDARDMPKASLCGNLAPAGGSSPKP